MEDWNTVKAKTKKKTVVVSKATEVFGGKKKGGKLQAGPVR